MLNHNFDPYEVILQLQQKVHLLEENQRRMIDAINNQGRALDGFRSFQLTTNDTLLFQTQTIKHLLEISQTESLKP